MNSRCPGSAELLQWMRGQLNEQLTVELRLHVVDCERCRTRLEELTDETSLEPPTDSASLTDSATFTNEPHFQSLRRRLSERAPGLTTDSTSETEREGKNSVARDPKSPNSQVENTLEGALDSTFASRMSGGDQAFDDERRNIDRQDDQLGLDAIEIPGFVIESLIGRGGFAHVYRAWDKQLQRSVAIKVLDRSRMSARNRQRFIREARIVSSLQSPHIVQVITCGETDGGQPYIVMELVEGETLAARISETDSLSGSALERGIRVLIQVGRGVQIVHDAGLIHRDIKPSNIFVSQGYEFAKLGDFGLARGVQDTSLTLTQAAELAGTPAYMSPEQTVAEDGEVDSMADIYSLGATLYHVLTGRAPFSGSSVAILRQVPEVEPTSPMLLNEYVSRDLETICLKAMSKQPEHRYPTAGKFADDLQRFVEGRPIQGRPLPGWQRLILWRRRNLAFANSLCLLLLAMVLGTVGTTAMWIRSSRNALQARQYADSLEKNRTRLRESVSRFQKRVFSEQAMHWQMPESFRAEMFTDVISYLDEFAELETPGELRVNHTDELTNDYLLVAKTALEVNRAQDAQTAADRALERILKLPGNQDPPGNGNGASEFNLLRFRAARLGYLSRTPTTKFFDLDNENRNVNLDKRQKLASECRESTQSVNATQQGDPLWQLRDLESQFLIVATKGSLNKVDLENANRQYQEMTDLLKGVHKLDSSESVEVVQAALSVGWFLSEVSPNPEARLLIERNLELVESLRNCLRVLNRSLTKSDWLKGNNYARLAVLKRDAGENDGAIESASEAQHAFRKAIELRPQNRLWANDMICLQLLLSDWLVEKGDLATANETMVDAIMNNIRLSKSYTDNFELQKRTVKMFVKLAQISERRKAHAEALRHYYVAAKDCQLIVLNEECRDWAVQTRLWILYKVLQQLELDEDPETRSQLMESEGRLMEGWREKFNIDTTSIRSVLDGGYHPKRPDYLEGQRITDDILSSN